MERVNSSGLGDRGKTVRLSPGVTLDYTILLNVIVTPTVRVNCQLVLSFQMRINWCIVDGPSIRFSNTV